MKYVVCIFEVLRQKKLKLKLQMRYIFLFLDEKQIICARQDGSAGRGTCHHA